MDINPEELIDRLTAENETLWEDFVDAQLCAKMWEQETQLARANELTAMRYLEQIRQSVAPDVDFPTLVQRCSEIQQERDQLKAVLDQCHEAMCEVSQAAYYNAFQVCCGNAVGTECCGSPEIGWHECDEMIMDTLSGPINAAANQLFAKAAASGGSDE